MEIKYTKRLVAYIDILGFKDIIDSTLYSSGKDNQTMMKYLLLTYKQLKRVFKPEYYTVARRYPYIIPIVKNSKIVTTFSDSIVVSFSMEEPKLLSDVLAEIHLMVKTLIWRGMICRGAITIGKLFHTPSVVFGPALVDAYLSETKHAKYPRIILCNSLSKIIRQNVLNDKFGDLYGVNDFILQDDDGLSFIDYFTIHTDNPPILSELSWLYMQRLYEIIKYGLKLSSHPDFRNLEEKYIWMKRNYNLKAEFYRSKEFYNQYYKNNDGFRSYNEDYEKVKIFK